MSWAPLMLIVVLLLAGAVQGVVIRRDLWPALAVPLDGGACLAGRRILGDNKTLRGAIVMVVATALVAAVLLPLVPPYEPPPAFGWTGLGAIMGIAYIVAELPNSFVKRRLGVGPGEASSGVAGAVQYLVDQGDSVVGVVVALAVGSDLDTDVLAVLAVLGVVAHAAFDVALHRFGVKRATAGRAPRT